MNQMKTIRLFMTGLALVFSIVIQAQSDGEKKLSLDQGTIDSQFEYVIKKSGNYQEYEVVKKVWMYKLRKNVSDSLTKSYAASNALQATIDNQKKDITSLQEQLKTTSDNLTKVTEEKDNISFFGSNWSKGSYKTLMWSIVGILGLLLAFFIFKFRNSNIITQEARQSLAEIEAEYEDHRRRSLEREQKVRRQLQDEINKQKGNKKA